MLGTWLTIALLKSHVQRDDQEFLSIAMEVAATEARQGHSQVAHTIKWLIDEAKGKAGSLPRPLLMVPNRSELSSLLLTTESDVRLCIEACSSAGPSGGDGA